MTETVEKTELAAAPRKRQPRARQAGPKPPEGVKLPTDHKPAKTEITGELKNYPVEWHGHQYEILADQLDDAELLEYFTDDNFVGAIRIMIGVDGWNEYKANERDPATGKVSATDAAKFLNHMLEVVDRKN